MTETVIAVIFERRYLLYHGIHLYPITSQNNLPIFLKKEPRIKRGFIFITETVSF